MTTHSSISCNANNDSAAINPRAKLDMALRSVALWPAQDQQFFVATFTSNKSEPDLAQQLGMSTGSYQTRRREILRRFMRAAREHLPAMSATPVAFA